MQTIPREQVLRRLLAENSWWSAPHSVDIPYATFTRRGYLRQYLQLLRETQVHRAVLLMGPRRVGKTVLIHHAIHRLLADGVPPNRIGYVSVDHPIYNGCSLQDLLDAVIEASGAGPSGGVMFLFFDEIQYLKDWEIHLKLLVDGYRNIRFSASGSAAAALRLKSIESGAGRFTDFLLPPVTFCEYIELLGHAHLIRPVDSIDGPNELFETTDIAALNDAFLHYLNFGGYPELAFSAAMQADPARYVKSDIIDKVLLRDLPGLYGIQDIQELNYLFTTLAFNTANEVSLEQLSQRSGVAKNTIRRYIEYLEAAFLIRVVHRVDRNARRFQRASFFKVYLTNPSIRSALFSPLGADDESMGSVVETAIFSQWFHSPFDLHYARWPQGEVDIVNLDAMQRLQWAVEVKWSDRHATNVRDLKSVLSFCTANRLDTVTVTTRSASRHLVVNDTQVQFVPASLYCYIIGRNLLR